MENSLLKEVTLTREFDAPRELVFKTWTDPVHLAAWWGPDGFTAPVCEVDPSPGGKIRILMDHPQFPDHWMGGWFHEIVEPERLVFTSTAFDGGNGPQLEILNTITFEEKGGKTKITVHAGVKKAAPEMSFAVGGMHEGWRQSLEKLYEYISNTVIKGVI